jgi:uncharacterized protein (TIGR03067 family)
MNSLCSIKMLESALAGNLSSDEELALQQHLEVCESCSSTIEDLAGGPSLCQQAAVLLGGDEFDTAASLREEWSVVDFTVEHLEPTDEPDMLGRLGGYDVLEIIGRGGMGVVLKGFDRELKRCVAIKVLAPHLAHSPLARKRFAREAQAAAAVVHPHVLAIHQVQPGGRLPFLVMPLVAGESLAQRLAARGTLELKEILRIGMQAAAGLAAAHEQGLVHRDVKPANILLEKGVERAVLTDFGLARAADDAALTRWGVIAGTPQYMSPEQAQGQALDGRSDLFSLGCILYEMATGTSPFRADSTIATMRRLVDDQPASMTTFNAELPSWFVQIVARLLEKSPAQRFGSAAEVSDLLERCLAHVQQPTTVSIPPEICLAPISTAAVPTKAAVPGRKRSVMIFSTLITVVLLVSCAWFLPAMFGSANSAKRDLSETNMHRLTAALIAYEEEHGHYPASAIYGKDGKGGPPHSWRVEILPYLGRNALYDQYHFDELWDSEHNRTLLTKMPAVFRSPVDVADSVNAAYFGVILEDPKTVFQVQPDGGPAGRAAAPGVTTGTGREAGGLGSGPEGSAAPPGGSGASIGVRLEAGSLGSGTGGSAAPPAEGVAPNGAGPGAIFGGFTVGGADAQSTDEFVSRKLAAVQLGVMLPVNKREWLRRVKLDLTGTIPTEAEYISFLGEDVRVSLDKTIDRLLKESKQLTSGAIVDGVFMPNGSTVFSRPQGAKNIEMWDGTSNTIAIVEAKRSLPWTKPEDLTYDSTQAASPFGGWYPEGWFAGFVDGKVKFLSKDNPPKVLRALLTFNDGENVAPILVSDSVTKSLTHQSGGQDQTAVSSPTGPVFQPWTTGWNSRESPTEATAFEGRWYLNSVVETGKPRREGQSYEPWIFNGDQVTIPASEMAGTWRVRLGTHGEPQNIDLERISDKSNYCLTGIFELKDDALRIAMVHSGPRPPSLNSSGPGDESRRTIELKRPGRVLSYRRNANPKIIEAHVGDVVMVTETASKVHVGGLSVNRTNDTVGYGIEEIDGKMNLIFSARKPASAEFSWSFNTKAGGRVEYSGLTIKFVERDVNPQAGVMMLDFGTVASRPGPVLEQYTGRLEGSRPLGEPRGMRTTDEEITPIAARHAFGSQFQVNACGRQLGNIYGTDVYTIDSPIDTVAMHAGLLRHGEKGVLTVTILKARQDYQGAERNGVISLPWTDRIEGYTLQKEPNPETNHALTRSTRAVATENSSVRALELLTQDDPAAAKLIESELRTELDDLDRLTTQHGRNSDVVLERTERFCKRILDGIRQRIDRRRQRTAEETSIIMRIDRLLAGHSQSSVTSSESTFSGIGGGVPARYRAQSIDAPTLNATEFRNRFGEQFDVEVTGSKAGFIWGTDVYTCDSSIALAAVHAGLVKIGEKATVTVTIVKSPAAHHGSERNGVTSNNWGSFPASFVLHRNAIPAADTAPNAVRLLWNRLNSARGTVSLAVGPQGTMLGSSIDLGRPIDGTDGWKSNPNNLKTAEEFKDNIGAEFDLSIVGHIHGKVVGTDLYRFDSVIAAAAVHAGLVGQGEPAVVTVKIIRPVRALNQPVSDGCSRNGVESTPFDDDAIGYTLTRNPTSAREFQAQLGFQFDVKVLGHTTGTAWGTDVYTCDSDIATASVHSGLVKSGESATVTVTIVKSPDKYTGSIRNGVTTLDYGTYPSGYMLTIKNASSTNFTNPPHLTSPVQQSEDEDGTRLNQKWLQLLTDCPGDQYSRQARQRMLNLSRELANEPQASAEQNHWTSTLRRDDVIQLQMLAFESRVPWASQKTVEPRSERNSAEFYLPSFDPITWAGQTLYVPATGRSDGHVWGAGPYTTDSDLGTAAVHAGRLKVGETGLLKLTTLGGNDQYSGSIANGVTTRPYGTYVSSFRIESLPGEVPDASFPETRSLRQVLVDATRSRIDRVPPDNVRLTEILNERLSDLHANSDIVLFEPDAGRRHRRGRSSLESFRNRVGQSFHFLVRGLNAGKSDHTTNLFNLDQNLADAAAQAGLVAPGDYGVVRVKIAALNVQPAESSERSRPAETIGFTVEKPAEKVTRAFLNLEGIEPQLDPELAAQLARFTDVICDGGYSGERFDQLQSNPAGLAQMRSVQATIRNPSDARWDARTVLAAAKQALQLPLTVPQRLEMCVAAGQASSLIGSPPTADTRAESAQWFLTGLQLVRQFNVPEKFVELPASEQRDFQTPIPGVQKELTPQVAENRLTETLIKSRTTLRSKLMDLYQDPRYPRPTLDELRRLREMAKARLDPLDPFLREIERPYIRRQ